jgi:hypothetical protein
VRSHGPVGLQAARGGEHARTERGAAASGGASPARAQEGVLGGQIKREWVLRVAGELAHTSRGSERGFGRPRRPAPKGDGAGPAGVRASVQQCVPETRNDRKTMLTTQGWFKFVHGQGRSRGGEVQRRRRP